MAKRALSEIFPNQEVVDDDPLISENDCEKKLFDVLSPPLKNANTSTLEPGQEHMKVFLRVRPLSQKEADCNEDQNCLEVLNDNTMLTHAPKDSHYFKTSTHGQGQTTHNFTFSKIFQESTTQKCFFNETMLGYVKDFVDGQNCLVFTYGVANAGKTYTFQGKPNDAGILPRALDVLFNSIEGKQLEEIMVKPKLFTDVVKLNPEEEAAERKLKNTVMKMAVEERTDMMTLLGADSSDASRITNTTASSGSSMNGQHSKESVDCFDELMDIENRGREDAALNVDAQGKVRFSVWISFAEIYNKQIFDLLEEIPKKKTQTKRTVLKISEDKKGNPYIKGLKYINVQSADEAYTMITIGQRNLRKACTKLNHSSSRSHCIFNIKLLRVVDTEYPNMARVSMLTLCDLAGSERYSKTQATGDRLKEAGNINTSLLILGRCIETLRFNQTHKKLALVPFRGAKLTRLFQMFFSGKGKVAMIVNVNKCASMFDETFQVFKFSAIAQEEVVVQKPDPKPKVPQPKCSARRSSIASASQSHREVQAITSSAISVPLPCSSDDDLEESDEEIKVLYEEIDELTNALKMEREQRLWDEWRIRKEVVSEMRSQIDKMESSHNDSLREERAAHEIHMEKKIELLKYIHSRNRKQPDKMEDDEDEWVSSVLLHAEKTKVEVRDRKIADLEAELATAKQQNEILQNTIKTKETSPKKTEEADLSRHSLVDSLSQQLEKTRDLLQEKETEVNELNETLNEAAATRISKLAESCKQRAEVIRELEKQFNESNSTLEEADEKPTSRDIQILHLETETDELKGPSKCVAKVGPYLAIAFSVLAILVAVLIVFVMLTGTGKKQHKDCLPA